MVLLHIWQRHRASRSCQADEFELDYVSSKRPSTTAKSLTDPLWERLMVWETQIGFGEDGNGHIKRTQMVPCFHVTRSCHKVNLHKSQCDDEDSVAVKLGFMGWYMSRLLSMCILNISILWKLQTHPKSNT